MEIGEVIRKYRKQLNMTQEEVATRLGVTAPAVNKWERGNSLPDITLLAPIARLFDISLDTLLSFQEELTDAQWNDLIVQLSRKLKTESFEEAFLWAKAQLERYPNCEQLCFWTAKLIEVQYSGQCDDFICDCYSRVLKSTNEDTRTLAADSLFTYYFHKEDYDKAEEYLEYFSNQNPERKRKQGLIYGKTNRIKESYKIYEEILFSEYKLINIVLHHIYQMSLQENNMNKASYLVEKQKVLVDLFDMGEYHKTAAVLDLAIVKKDVEMTIGTIEHLLTNVHNMNSYSTSLLYEHMGFQELQEESVRELKEQLKKSLLTEDRLDFLKEDKRWVESIFL